MGLLGLEMYYMTHPDERGLKILIYSLLEDFGEYVGFIFNGMVWKLGKHKLLVSPEWIESESGFSSNEESILKRARETYSQPIRTNVALDDEIKAAIIDSHTKGCLIKNPSIYFNGDEIRFIDRTL